MHEPVEPDIEQIEPEDGTVTFVEPRLLDTLLGKVIFVIACFFLQAAALAGLDYAEQAVLQHVSENVLRSVTQAIVLIPSFKIAGVLLGVNNCSWGKCTLLHAPFIFIEHFLIPIIPTFFFWYGWIKYVLVLILAQKIFKTSIIGTFVFVLLGVALVFLVGFSLFAVGIYDSS